MRWFLHTAPVGQHSGSALPLHYRMLSLGARSQSGRDSAEGMACAHSPSCKLCTAAHDEASWPRLAASLSPWQYHHASSHCNVAIASLAAAWAGCPECGVVAPAGGLNRVGFPVAQAALEQPVEPFGIETKRKVHGHLSGACCLEERITGETQGHHTWPIMHTVVDQARQCCSPNCSLSLCSASARLHRLNLQTKGGKEAASLHIMPWMMQKMHKSEKH